MNLMPVGISNQLFYFMNGGEGSAFDICFRFVCEAPPDRAKLRRAIEATLKNFPEFALRPAIRGNAVWGMPNENEVPLLDDDGSILHYGTEETAGYLFAFRCSGAGFSFSYFHGLADFHGIWCFLRTLFYHYALEQGLSVPPDDFVRLDAAQMVSADEQERLDPYRRFAPAGDDALPPPDLSDAFALPEDFYDDDVPYCTSYEIRTPLKDFLAAAKERQTSVSALLSLLAARAVAGLYDRSGKPIRIMTSADMRKYYGAKTMVNFSDAVFLDYDDTISDLPFTEQAGRLRAALKAQMSKEHFDPLLLQKTKTVQGWLRSGLPITEWNRRFREPPPKNVMTIALTYPGSLDLPPAYQPLVREITRDICILGAKVFGLSVMTFGGTMYIRSSQRFASDAIMRGMERELGALGLQTEFSSLKPYRGNLVLTERFAQLE